MLMIAIRATAAPLCAHLDAVGSSACCILPPHIMRPTANAPALARLLRLHEMVGSTYNAR